MGGGSLDIWIFSKLFGNIFKFKVKMWKSLTSFACRFSVTSAMYNFVTCT